MLFRYFAAAAAAVCSLALATPAFAASSPCWNSPHGQAQDCRAWDRDCAPGCLPWDRDDCVPAPAPHPGCHVRLINFDFPHGSTVLTENWGPVLHDGDFIMYGGDNYEITDVTGNHFSAETLPGLRLVFNQGPGI